MRQADTALEISTQGFGLYEFTDQAAGWVRGLRMEVGLLTVFVRHTSASLTIQENADPSVRHDLEEYFRRLVPEDEPWYRHRSEGPDDMPAHIKGALTDVSLSVPLYRGGLGLGTWQGIYLFEHRRRPHRRQVLLHCLGQ